MSEFVFIFRTYHISSHGGLQFLLLSEIERQLVKGASGSRNQFVFDLTHSPNPCMKCRIDHHMYHFAVILCLIYFVIGNTEVYVIVISRCIVITR